MASTATQKIDGKVIADTIRAEVKAEVAELTAKYDGKKPGLATVLVGDREDSAVYVRMKHKACAELGMHAEDRHLSGEATQEEVLKTVQELNANPLVNGILVQLPMPKHINEEEILNAISLEKDVDGFHPINVGRICMKGRKPLYAPCTPKGCIELLDRSGIPIEGKNAVVLGRSNIVGIPVANLLLHRNATVTICHSRTKDIAEVVKRAEILVAAIGIPHYVKKEWLQEGVVVIDVGINSIPDDTKKSGKRLVGDVDTEGAQGIASAITPVPGGVGPMTIAMLMRNCLDGFKRSVGIEVEL